MAELKKGTVDPALKAALKGAGGKKKSGGGKKLGRNKVRCQRYAAARRREANRDRRAKARAARLLKRGRETVLAREERAMRSHQRRHLLRHGLPATEGCAVCIAASLL